MQCVFCRMCNRLLLEMQKVTIPMCSIKSSRYFSIFQWKNVFIPSILSTRFRLSKNSQFCGLRGESNSANFCSTKSYRNSQLNHFFFGIFRLWSPSSDASLRTNRHQNRVPQLQHQYNAVSPKFDRIQMLNLSKWKPALK